MSENKIFIVTGKDIHVKLPYYQTIVVGDKVKKNTNYEYDSTGDNIANKNPYYCELTALYWIWKNTTMDYVGMCHYRRFFDFNDKDMSRWVMKQSQCLEDILENIAIKSFKTIMDDKDIVLPKPLYFCCSVEKDYIDHHRKEDLDIIKTIIAEKYPDYMDAVKSYFKGNKLYYCNMFVMKKEMFDEYMEWLFDILFEVEKRIDIPYDDKVQRRVFGFLAERLFGIYIKKNEFKIKEYPLIFIQKYNDGDRSLKDGIKYKIKKYMNIF